jgi:hypothetical protein
VHAQTTSAGLVTKTSARPILVPVQRDAVRLTEEAS